MDYRYIYNFFDSEEESVEYLIQKLCNDDISTVIRDQDSGEMKTVSINQNNDDQMKKELFGVIIKSMYGKNSIIMANYFYSEEIFKNIIETHILKYLKLRGIEANILHINTSAITTRYLIYKTLHDRNFKPISRWSPDELWDVNMAYGKHADINLLNPINQCDSAYIIIKGKIFSKFADEACKHGFDVQIYTNGGIIKALPTKSSAIIIKLVQLIHKYF